VRTLHLDEKGTSGVANLKVARRSMLNTPARAIVPVIGRRHAVDGHFHQAQKAAGSARGNDNV
jgi:hypothetical protein